MTTKDIIKSLPLEEALKMEILNTYDFLDKDQQLSIQRIAWRTYHSLFEMRLQENLELEFNRVAEGKGKFSEEFYATALKRTEHEMDAEFQETMAKMDLASARKAMEQIVKEINAVKK